MAKNTNPSLGPVVGKTLGKVTQPTQPNGIYYNPQSGAYEVRGINNQPSAADPFPEAAPPPQPGAGFGGVSTPPIGPGQQPPDLTNIAAAHKALLEQGAKGQFAVTQPKELVARAKNQAKYNPTDANGVPIDPFVGASPESIGQFQTTVGIPVTGVNDATTQAALQSLRTQAGAGDTAGSKSAQSLLKGLAANPVNYTAKQATQAADARSAIRDTIEALAGRGAAAKNSQVARAALGIKNQKQAEAAIAQLMTAASGDDFTAIQIGNNLKKATAASMLQSARGKGNVFTNNILPAVGVGAEAIFTPFHRAFAAGEYAAGELKGSLGQAAQAAAYALHGGHNLNADSALGSGQHPLDQTKDKIVLKALADTHSAAQRQKLHEQGKLPSPGELVTGGLGFNPTIGIGDFHPLSGLLDAATQLAEPGNFALGSLLGAAKPFEAASEEAAAAATRAGATKEAAGAAARAAVKDIYENTAVGRALSSDIDKFLASSGPKDTGAFTRAFKGIDSAVAAEAAGASTAAEAKTVLEDALQKGLWRPTVKPLVGQEFIKSGLRSTTGAVKDEGGIMGALRRAASETPGFARAASFTHNTKTFAEGAITAALQKADKNISRFRGDFEKSAGVGTGSVQRRVARVLTAAGRSDDASFNHLAEQRLRPYLLDAKGLFTASGESYGGKRLENAVAKKLAEGSQEGLDAALRDLESVRAILDGKAGEGAATQMRAELDQGLVGEKSGFRTLVGKGAKNVGLSAKAAKGKAYKDGEVEKLVSKLPDGPLRDRAQAELAAAGTKSARAKLGVSVERLLKDANLKDEVTRLIHGEDSKLGAQAGHDLAGIGLGAGGLKARLSKGVLAVVEKAPVTRISLSGNKSTSLNIAERVEAIDRTALSFHLTSVQRAALRDEAARVSTEDELFRVATKPFLLAARDQGIAPHLIEELDAGMRAKLHEDVARGFFANQTTGEIDRTLRTLAQRKEWTQVPQPAQLKEMLSEELASGGNRMAKLRVALDHLGNMHVFGLEKSVTMTLKAAHSLWKLLVVTNLQLPFVGAVAGATAWATGVSGPGAIAAGAAVGSLAPLRYISRVALEQRIRNVMDRGFHPLEFIPGISKWLAEHDIAEPFRFGDGSALRSGGFAGTGAGDGFFAAAENDWTALKPGQRGFEDAWARTIQYQLQPDVYNVDNILLRERAGTMTSEEATAALTELKASEEGKSWLSRMTGAANGPKNWKEAVSGMREMVDTYVTPTLAKARLDGEVITADTVHGEIPPEFVHAQKAGSLLSGGKLWRNYSTGAAHKLFDFAHGTLGSEPLARWTYADNYDFLTRVMGMDGQRAGDYASQIAVQHTRSIMPFLDNSSRFARKADYIFPFQGIRENFFKSWAGLVVNNPLRTIQLTHLGALAFNNGQDVGIFRKDPISGQWVMTIPGSGVLSNALGGFNAQFDVNLKDLFFLGQSGAFGVNIAPTPGGPYWMLASEGLSHAFPQFLEKDNPLTQWLMPFGPGGDLFRPENRRLWAGITGSPAPWSFIDPNVIEGEFNRNMVEVAKSLYAVNVKNGMRADDAWPTDEQVKEGTRNFFKLWAFMGTVAPATPRAVFPDKQQYDRAQKAFTLNGTIPFDRNAFVAKYPEYAPFVLPTTKWVGPGDYGLWDDPIAINKQFALNYRESVTYDEFKQEFKQFQKDAKAYTDRNNIYASPAGADRDQALIAWQAQHPDLAKKSQEVYYRTLDLAQILVKTPKGTAQDNSINRWRQQYNVSRASLPAQIDKARKFVPSPWSAARATPQIVDSITKSMLKGVPEQNAVGQLAPAEQVRYYDWQRFQLDLNWKATDNPQQVLALYEQYGKNASAVIAGNPLLGLGTTVKNPFEQYVAQLKVDHKTATSAIVAEIDSITSQMNTAAQAKQWTAYYALKDKQQTLYDMKAAVANDLYKKYPDLTKVADDVKASTIALDAGNITKFQQLQAQLAGDKSTASITFVPTSEEAYYLSLPDHIRQAYVQQLSQRLDAPSASGVSPELKQYLKDQGDTKLYWDSLTNFAQDLLTKNLPPDQVHKWALESYVTLNQLNKNVKPVGAAAFDGNHELAWAFSLMQQYDARGGVDAPRAYEEYLALPANPQVRTDFLVKHPDVSAYMEAGGFLQMPEADRAFVQQVLMKYTQSQSNSSSSFGQTNFGPTVNGVTGLDVKFAEEQLSLWNRRPKGAMAPETYNLWLNMPTGQDKASFLNSHPEIQDWLKLGPMSNMPNAYQEIVRDIMVRYGLWTADQNPLGDVINAYYSTPSYAREKYLQAHPEILAYWSALRSPEENAKQSLADRYYSIQDPNARKAFLAASPPLQQFLVDARNKRYDRFLNQVAYYMGQNPDLFQSYLQRQTEILNELLRRFGEVPLTREVIQTPKGQTKAPHTLTRAHVTQSATSRQRAA